MYRVKVLPSKLAGLIRYRCACGYCKDIKHEPLAPSLALRLTRVG